MEVFRLRCASLDTTRGWAGEASSAEPRFPSSPQRRHARPALKNTASRRGRRPERPKSSAEYGTADRPWHTVLNIPRGLSMISAETGAPSAVFFTALTFSPLLCQDKRGTHPVSRSPPPTKKATRSHQRKTKHEHAIRSCPPDSWRCLDCAGAPLDTTGGRAGEHVPYKPTTSRLRSTRPGVGRGVGSPRKHVVSTPLDRTCGGQEKHTCTSYERSSFLFLCPDCPPRVPGGRCTVNIRRWD